MSRRTQKVNSVVRSEISRLFLQEIADPNLRNMVVTDVDLSPDLRLAKVFYSTGMMDQKTPPKEIKKSIAKVSPFVRRKLGQALEMRHVPEIEFVEDLHTENVNRLMRLFHEMDSQKA